jgi:heme exporter protein A
MLRLFAKPVNTRAYKGFSRNLPHEPVPNPRCEHGTNVSSACLAGALPLRLPGGGLMRLVGRDLGCTRGGREVLAGVSFSVAAGEALAVTGRNGAGKTTLLRVIAGLLELAAGHLELTGGPPEATLAEQAHYLGHRDGLKPALSVRENLAFWYAFLGGSDAPAASNAVAAALESVGLAALAGLPAAYLSAGQRRRLAIARLLAAPRPVWLLDEPTAALDTASQERLAELMRNHLAGGGIIVAATHGPLGIDARDLRLDSPPPPQAPRALSSMQPGPGPVAPNDSAQVGQARIAMRQGGGAQLADSDYQTTTPTPDPSPQGEGNRER